MKGIIMAEQRGSKPSAEADRTETAAASQHEDTPPRDEQEAPAAAIQTDEIGGPVGPEPTRYGDWERKGRCIDF